MATARGWIGTKFLHGQAQKGLGCDCAGLLRGVGKEAWLIPADFEERPEYAQYRAYTRNPDGRLLRACHAFLTPIRASEALPADIVLMKFGLKEPHHLVLIADILHAQRNGNNRIASLSVIHALNQPGVMRVIEMTVDEQMRARDIDSFHRFKRLA